MKATLGETGLLGFVTFYGVVVIALYFTIRLVIASSSYYSKAIAIGFIAATVGLLINAIFIDVFASSKVAFTYWALSGFIVAYCVKELAEIKLHHPYLDTKTEAAILPKPKQ